MKTFYLMILLLIVSTPLQAMSAGEADDRLLAWSQQIAQGKTPAVDTSLLSFLYLNRHRYPHIDYSDNVLKRSQTLFTTYTEMRSILSNLILSNVGYFDLDRARLIVCILALSNQIVATLPNLLTTFDKQAPSYLPKVKAIEQVYQGITSSYIGAFTLAFNESHGNNVNITLINALYQYYPAFRKHLPQEHLLAFDNELAKDIKPNVLQSKTNYFNHIQKYNH